MGFFDGLIRMVQGKPVFEVPTDQSQSPSPAQSSGDQPAARPSGPKVLPEVWIERTECRVNGSQMSVSCVIRNSSSVPIELDKIRLLNTSRELDDFLRPGENKEFQVYSGQKMKGTQPDDCELQFKDETGDYFVAFHHIDFTLESDNTYSVKQFQFQRPIRDV